VSANLGLDFGQGWIDPNTNKPGISPGLLGFISSCYQLGSILAVPIAPWLNQTYGRRWSVFIGSVIMVIGAILQGFAQHGG
jgi:MFS family permease